MRPSWGLDLQDYFSTIDFVVNFLTTTSTEKVCMELKTTLTIFFIWLCIETRHTLSLQREKEGKRHRKEPEPTRTS